MTKTLLVISNKLLQVFLIIILFFYVYDVINYLTEPNSYKFGTEVAGWRYNSPYNYLGTLLFDLLLIGGVLGAGFSQLKTGTLLQLRCVAFVLVVSQWFF